MKSAKRASNRFILPLRKIKKAKKILATKTEAETVERALDRVIADEKIRKALRLTKAACDIEDVYGRLCR